ncbi:MAG: tetratricopeptide repeat protein, partial [Marinilabiliaceae bacterium]|nr:tetratricopeptide repeat protein [Marinilabiliaceae bacterium]
MSSALWAQTEGGMLSIDGRKFLHQLYHPQEEQKAGDLKASEYIYLTAYRYFIEFISFEQDSSAAHFMDTFDRFSEFPSAQNNQITQLMLVNLSIQKGLIQWMKNEQFAGVFSFINGHRLLMDDYTNPSLLQEVRKLRSLFLILIDQLPDYMMSGASLFGLEGDRIEGFSLLQEYVEYCEDKEGVYTEALVLYGYCLMKFSNGDKYQMDQFIQKARQNESPLLTFVSASVAIKKRDGETARGLLDELQPETFECFPLLYHLKGKAVLNTLSNECEWWLSKFVHLYPGMSFKADAHLRLARYYRIIHDSVSVKREENAIRAMDVYPTSNDKQASQEAFMVAHKPESLIKARLLFDDGQIKECIVLLKTIDQPLLADFYRAEWHYRLARALEEENRYKEAVSHYEQVLPIAREDDRYIGPYSALNAAEIYLKIFSDSTSCKKMLQKAKEFNTGQYKSD